MIQLIVEGLWRPDELCQNSMKEVVILMVPGQRLVVSMGRLGRRKQDLAVRSTNQGYDAWIMAVKLENELIK